MRSPAPRMWLTVVGLIGAASLLCSGCERWPWESPPPPQTSPQEAPPTNPLAISVPEQERVATVSGTSLSTGDVELATLELKRFMEAYQQDWKTLSATEDPNALDLVDILNNLIDAELKTADARGRGLDQRLEVKRRLAYLLRGFYAQEWDRWQRERSLPTEEEVHQFYEQNKVGFADPERIRVRQIVSETLAEAEAVRGQAIQGAVFAQLARERSVGAGKEQGGEIGWHLRAFDLEVQRRMGKITEQDDLKAFFPQLEQVAFALEPKQVSQPVKGPDNRYYVVQLDERKPARQQTELEVHDAIKELLTLQKLQDKLEQLRTNAKIERFPERLGSVQQ